MITLQLQSYDLEIAQMIITMSAIERHPELNLREVAKLLNIGKSSLYRNVEYYKTEEFKKKIADQGYGTEPVLGPIGTKFYIPNE